MHRWNLRALALIVGCAALTSVVRADEPAPPPKPVTPVAPPVVVADPFRAATPYNATVVRRTVPNPQLNRRDFTLPCENPNQNFASFVPAQPECIKNIFGRSDCGSGGGSGCGSGCGKHADGGCSQGSCATCGNTTNFVWSGSRSFFGESSREFFERPPSVDAVRHKWNPIPVLYRTEK
jgi:hypothetical protein